MTEPLTVLHALHQRAAQLADRPALWTKRDGTYLPTSWRGYARAVRELSLGLEALGVEPGRAVAIMGFNREEWLVTQLAGMALGAVMVGVYTTSSPEQVEYVLGHSETEIAVVENERYLAVVQALRHRLPKLKHVLVMDPPSVRPEGVKAWADVRAAGALRDPARYDAHVERLKPSDLAALIYTSGTTGNPKGVMLSHHNLTWTVARTLELIELRAGEDSILSYLPLSHVAEQLISIYGALLGGLQVYFAESMERLPQNIKEVRPTCFFGVPRVWEKFKAKAEERMAQLPPHRRALVTWARSVARERHAHTLEGGAAPLWVETQYRLAQRLVFDALKGRIGFDRARVLATSAAPIGLDVLEFFVSVDLVVQEIYGQSEVTGPTSGNVAGAIRLGTLGKPIPGVEVKIADDGEILVRGANVCLGYFKDQQATAELLDAGWLHSGDLGELDPNGYLKVTGRKKDIIVTSGGKKTAPANLEAMLKAIPPVGNAIVLGERRNYLVALLPLDAEKVAAFAQARGWPASAAALAEHPPFLEYVAEAIERDVNSRVAKFETLKKFRVLPVDFTTEGGELTPTLKVRRKVVEEKYASLIEAMYAAPEQARAG